MKTEEQIRDRIDVLRAVGRFQRSVGDHEDADRWYDMAFELEWILED